MAWFIWGGRNFCIFLFRQPSTLVRDIRNRLQSREMKLNKVYDESILNIIQSLIYRICCSIIWCFLLIVGARNYDGFVGIPILLFLHYLGKVIAPRNIFVPQWISSCFQNGCRLKAPGRRNPERRLTWSGRGAGFGLRTLLNWFRTWFSVLHIFSQLLNSGIQNFLESLFFGLFVGDWLWQKINKTLKLLQIKIINEFI